MILVDFCKYDPCGFLQIWSLWVSANMILVDLCKYDPCGSLQIWSLWISANIILADFCDDPCGSLQIWGVHLFSTISLASTLALTTPPYFFSTMVNVSSVAVARTSDILVTPSSLQYLPSSGPSMRMSMPLMQSLTCSWLGPMSSITRLDKGFVWHFLSKGTTLLARQTRPLNLSWPNCFWRLKGNGL